MPPKCNFWLNSSATAYFRPIIAISPRLKYLNGLRGLCLANRVKFFAKVRPCWMAGWAIRSKPSTAGSSPTSPLISHCEWSSMQEEVKMHLLGKNLIVALQKRRLQTTIRWPSIISSNKQTVRCENMVRSTLLVATWQTEFLSISPHDFTELTIHAGFA